MSSRVYFCASNIVVQGVIELLGFLNNYTIRKFVGVLPTHDVMKYTH